MQLEFNFPISMTCIHYTTLHLRIPKREKMLVKLPHLTQQHHLPNQHGAKIGLIQKCNSIFLLQLQQNLLLYGQIFSQRFQFIGKKVVLHEKQEETNTKILFVDNIQDIVWNDFGWKLANYRN